jgi:uncharacterized protein
LRIKYTLLIKREAYQILQKALTRQAAVALLGPRQVGKTTLALEVGKVHHAMYLDVESGTDRDQLADPELFLSQHQTLRGLIDRSKRMGQATEQYLILGSASVSLLRQSSESLAGRIEYIHLDPLHLLEVGTAAKDALHTLFLRGGFPDSF